MPRKARKRTATNKSVVTRNKENNDDLSLPVLSDEKILSCDDQKASLLKEGKVPEILIPQVRLTCLPLNVEKVIDLTTSELVKKKDGGKKIPRKKKNTEKSVRKSSLKHIEVKTGKNLRPRFKDEEEYRYLYNSPSSNVTNGPGQKKIKIYIKESKFILRKNSVATKQNQKEEIKSDKPSLEVKTENCTLQNNLRGIEEESGVVTEKNVHDVNFDLKSVVRNLKDEELDQKVSENTKSQSTGEVAQQHACIKPAELCPEEKSSQSCMEDKCNDSNELKCASLQSAMESLMNNSQLENGNDVDALKKGLCIMWMSNNYKCTSKLCPYHHNALNLFTKKLKQHSSRQILTVLLTMKNDVLFVDAVLAAFKILSERKAPTVWITFLIYFVFYVTEPSDSRFFKFWASAARFFYGLEENFGAAKGFASLLSVFSLGDKSEEWKIIEFIKFIKQPPIQIHTTYDLLQPVLNLNLPSQFLVEAVEHSIATNTDVLEVYFLIIPKISIMTSPTPTIELLLKFCSSLESLQHENLVVGLKQKLKEKIRTFKIKIFHRDYPLTAAFQEQLMRNRSPDSSPVEMFGNSTLLNSQIVLRKNNYFQPGDDFYKVIEYNYGKPFGNLVKSSEKTEKSVMSKKEEDSACDRQVSRVKQFFNDCHFDILGKYLNNLKPEAVEQTAEEFLKALFQMKITLQQVVDLMKIILLHCQSEVAAKINASACVSLIFNLVKINEWEKAHTILSLCEKKGINLVEGKTALDIVKTYSLHSSNHSLWKLSWRENDETIRVQIVEEFLAQAVAKQSTIIAYNLFMLIWIDQNSLYNPIDLGKFTNDMLILLLNQNLEEGVKFFQKIRGKVTLEETTTRAILVALVGQNNLREAKNVFQGIEQTTYTFPEITPAGATVTISSIWLEEEIYLMLDLLFDILTNEMNSVLRNYENFEVNIHVVKPKAMPSNVRPLCLGLINSSLEHACRRIERVLQNQFKPPVKLIILPYSLLLEKDSLKLYLEQRFRRIPEQIKI